MKSMKFTDEQKGFLEAKLDPQHIQKPSGSFGPKGDYIEGWHAIAEANRIFGYDEWDYKIVDLRQCADPYQNQKENWIVSYIAIVEVETHGVIRQDVGYGSGASKQIGDAVEGATKEAVTDALKRALRTFGNQFGLALYDKQKRNVGAPEQPANQTLPKKDARQVYEDLKDEAGRKKTREELEVFLSSQQAKQAYFSLPNDWRTEFEADLNHMKQQLKSAA